MSSTSSTSASLRRGIADFYWGVWSELGVSGWARTHEDWAIDPEPLIVFSTAIGEFEPRLRAEVLDWCVRNTRHVSTVRLRHLLEDNPSEHSDAWGRFAAAANRLSGAAKWPHPTTEDRFGLTGRSALRSLSEPSMFYLRMRSIFGLGARTEVLRSLLVSRDRATAAMLAAQTQYAKRNVAEACDMLTLSGVLRARQVGNRLYFSLADERALVAFVGPLPRMCPDWPALLRIVNALLRWTTVDGQCDDRVLAVETHQVLADLHDDLDSLGLNAPAASPGASLVPVWREWTATLVASLASGRYPADGRRGDAGRQLLETPRPGARRRAR